MVDGCHFIPSFQISRACGSPTTSLCFNRLDYSHYVSGCRKARCNRPCLFHYDQHRPYLDILGIHAGYTGTDLHLPFFCPEYFSCRMRQKREASMFYFYGFCLSRFFGATCMEGLLQGWGCWRFMPWAKDFPAEDLCHLCLFLQARCL